MPMMKPDISPYRSSWWRDRREIIALSKQSRGSDTERGDFQARNPRSAFHTWKIARSPAVIYDVESEIVLVTLKSVKFPAISPVTSRTFNTASGDRYVNNVHYARHACLQVCTLSNTRNTDWFTWVDPRVILSVTCCTIASCTVAIEPGVSLYEMSKEKSIVL